MLILAVVIIATAAALTTNISITSYSKHRVQAMYIAKQTIEEMRKHSFGDLANYALNPNHCTGQVCIDVLDYNNGTCGLWGNRVVTVTNIPIDPYRKTVQVKVSWAENIAGVSRSMQEYCTTDIANATTLN